MEDSNLTAEDIAAWFRSSDRGLDEAKNAHGAESGLADLGDLIEVWSSLADTAFGFGVSYVALGTVAILMNAAFLFALLSKRTHTFSHVFYVMIFNFALIDTIKGVCSILFALKLLKSDMNSGGTLWAVKVDQMSGVLLRFSNLATILNLSMITVNEYLYICYPLQYLTWVTKRRVVFCIIFSWITSFLLTFVNSVLGMSHRSILIDQDCQIKQMTNDNTDVDLLECILQVDPSRVSHYVYHFGMIIFCILCLAVTACSYIVLLRVISRVVKADMKHSAEMEQLKDCNGNNGEQRRMEKHIVRRHKYVVVIGTVIIVYSAYLTTYAIIQLLQLINMSQSSTSSQKYGFVYLKYVCYIFISLHSILQPLCYLRMREFRILIQRAFCRKPRARDITTENYFLHPDQTRITSTKREMV